jgi:regulator of protease activity HflC (stomatin/prohibitin superfamily)
MYEKNVATGVLWVIGILLFFALVALCMWIFPTYGVWQQAQSGKAKLAEAEYSRKIAVCEAEAKMESAEKWGKAEITKAKAMAEANAILATSLKNNHEYLVYLWIESLKETSDKIIYVPTEAGLPVLEANRLLNQITK